jgi:glycosyltransferase involved in cell wall biosynthesis
MKINIVLPVYNEEAILKKSALAVQNFCRQNLPDYDCLITIADNASTDQTEQIGHELGQISGINYLRLPQKGRGRALKLAWTSTEANIHVYMDIDLATDLSALPILIKTIEQGVDLAIGSRLLPQSQLKRSLIRQITSLTYCYLVRFYLGLKIRDYQCGFKAINQRLVKELLPQVKDNEFFFDTELIARAIAGGYVVKEIPVNWSEFRQRNRQSTVKIYDTAKKYLLNLRWLKKELK